MPDPALDRLFALAEKEMEDLSDILKTVKIGMLNIVRPLVGRAHPAEIMGALF